MATKKSISTKTEIVRTALGMFLEKGFSNTSVKMISDELGISTGNLTFHFPSKWHLLSVAASMLCDFRAMKMKEAVQKGETLLGAQCHEIISMVAICEANELARDFYLQLYTHPLTLTVMRLHSANLAKAVFAPYCKNWNDIHFAEAQTLVSGIEFGTLMVTEDSADTAVRIAGALSCIMNVYDVPANVRRLHIQKATAGDFRSKAQKSFLEFISYVQSMDDDTIEKYL